MSVIEKLSQKFAEFPGIGPRGSRRFVYFLLRRNHQFLDELAHLLLELKKEVATCTHCNRFFAASSNDMCSICNNSNRDASKLMLIEKDVDLEAVERSGTYTGHYFVLGGSVPILEKTPERRIRQHELLKRLADAEIKEIIIALSANPQGENTFTYLEQLLSPLAQEQGFTISTLGRGLSTGSELEYSDPETIKNALMHRT